MKKPQWFYPLFSRYIFQKTLEVGGGGSQKKLLKKSSCSEDKAVLKKSQHMQEGKLLFEKEIPN